jgi:hypothetical protein
MFFALAFRFAKCALRFKNRNRFAGDFGRVRGASDGSGGGQGKGVDWRAHGVIRARREVHLEGGCGTGDGTTEGRAHRDAPLHVAVVRNSRRQRERWRIVAPARCRCEHHERILPTIPPQISGFSRGHPLDPGSEGSALSALSESADLRGAGERRCVEIGERMKSLEHVGRFVWKGDVALLL